MVLETTVQMTGENRVTYHRNQKTSSKVSNPVVQRVLIPCFRLGVLHLSFFRPLHYPFLNTSYGPESKHYRLRTLKKYRREQVRLICFKIRDYFPPLKNDYQASV